MLYNKPTIYKTPTIYNTGASSGGGSINMPGFMLYGANFSSGQGAYFKDSLLHIGSNGQRSGIYPDITPLSYSQLNKLEICIKCKIAWFEYVKLIGRGCDENNNFLGRVFRVIYNRTDGGVQLYLPTSDGTGWQSVYKQVNCNLTNGFYSVGVILEKETNNVKLKIYVLDNNGSEVGNETANTGFDIVPGNDSILFGFGKEERNQVSNNFYYKSTVDFSNTFIKVDDSLTWGHEE